LSGGSGAIGTGFCFAHATSTTSSNDTRDMRGQ
jgi:hypothetical protein